jgi:hypothetical protein
MASKLGDTVFYYPGKNEFHSDQPGPLSAVVSKVNANGSVNLAVFTGQGACEGRSNVLNNPASRPVLGGYAAASATPPPAAAPVKLPPLAAKPGTTVPGQPLPKPTTHLTQPQPPGELPMTGRSAQTAPIIPRR